MLDAITILLKTYNYKINEDGMNLLILTMYDQKIVVIKLNKF